MDRFWYSFVKKVRVLSLYGAMSFTAEFAENEIGFNTFYQGLSYISLKPGQL